MRPVRIKGFPQWFFCPTAIFRAGPNTFLHGDPWVYAVLVEFRWSQIIRRFLGLKATVTIWALSTKGTEQAKLDWSYARPLFRWLRSIGYEPHFIRIKTPEEMKRNRNGLD